MRGDGKVSRTCVHCGEEFHAWPSRVRQGAALSCSAVCRRASETPAAQLQSRVDRSAGPDACWPWTGRRDSDGYGLLWYGGERFRAHRIAWERANDLMVPDGSIVRHLCPGGGNPWCCNPKHLLPGTHDENKQDAIRSQRQALGVATGRTTLTADDVRSIRAQHDAGATRAALARAFGISRSAVGHIVKRRVWKYLGDDVPVPSRMWMETGS